ncbi:MULTISPECIES: acyl carrier protein [Pseudomonas]|uniref:Carrier domain-containing protein n=3 Tax=Pseudomonas TaxID=286 RepID=A0A0G3GLG6_9PSED|nr:MULTISPECIES: acyl carrier protein [Pseudomonas]AKK00358.1 hypothetical protein VM99_20625 [Pseudomonas chlororaphis]KIQ61079.1 hypothetical protein RL74_02175 [Pseudomonas fluorescens]ROM87195.1 hypothetical protein BK652_03240 [Pseudomonas brassicacearum]BBP63170.1 hypothetical protein PHLH5_07110 [Pseudomonas sp. Cab53]
MNLDAIKKELAELLELRESELQADVLLHPLSNWDSLTKVTLLGVLNDQFGFALSPALLDEVETIGELFDAIQADAAHVRVGEPS